MKKPLQIPEPPFWPMGNFHQQNECHSAALTKLVRSWACGCGYDSAGLPMNGNAGVHVLVTLDAIYSQGEWFARIGAHDHDDLCEQIWKPLTEANWRELHDMYTMISGPVSLRSFLERCAKQ